MLTVLLLYDTIIAKAYADAYEGTGYTAEEIWEECVCDSLGDMNIFSKEENNALMKRILPEIKEAASESKAPAQTRGSPEGKASRETGDLYTATDAFYRDVHRGDRAAFARSLANKTTGMVEGEKRTIYVAGYIFEATGYMQGRIIAKYNDKTKQILEDAKNERKQIKQNTEVAALWAGSVKYARRGSGGDSGVLGGRRSSADDRLLSSSSRSDTSGDNERVRQTPRTEEEYHEIVNKAREMFGLEPVDYGKQGKSSREFSSPEEAKESGKVGDAKFSIEFADDIADKQRKYAADGLSRISSEELEQAIADTAHMVNEMKPYANILPQDKVGKTLVKNGSYDVSVENTTVCIRTLAYNSFVDMVSEKVGRPLTQMESFLVSQKLYEIAKEPQCLYCYVSLDRKAFNEWQRSAKPASNIQMIKARTISTIPICRTSRRS